MALNGLGDMAENTIARVLGLIVVLALLGGTIALVFTNMDTLIDAFSGYNGSDPVVTAIVGIFGLVLGVFIVLGIVRIVQRATDV